MTSHYDDDATPDDIRPGDQCSLVCPCGHRTIPAWRTLPREQQLTPLRDLRSKMVCKRCGRRRPDVVIAGHYGQGGDLKDFWRWPTANRT